MTNLPLLQNLKKTCQITKYQNFSFERQHLAKKLARVKILVKFEEESELKMSGSCKNCNNTDFEAHNGAFYCTGCGCESPEQGKVWDYDLYGTTYFESTFGGSLRSQYGPLKASSVGPQGSGQNGIQKNENIYESPSMSEYPGAGSQGSVGHGKSEGSQGSGQNGNQTNENNEEKPIHENPILSENSGTGSQGSVVDGKSEGSQGSGRNGNQTNENDEEKPNQIKVQNVRP